ncbi:MAG: phosphoglycerate kinase, partial [Desulfurococcaceae archaeon]
DMKGLVMDIGEQTAGIYEELIKEAKTVVMRGPAGVIEKEEFRAGTLRLLNASLSSKGFVLIAGGHLSAMAQHVEQSGKVHVSTAGNSLLLFLSGEELPAFKALELSAKMFLGW